MLVTFTPHMRALYDAGGFPPTPNTLLIEWPADDRRDWYGRLMFTAWWLTEGTDRLRGQVFQTNPELFAADWEARGWTVRLTDAAQP